MVPPPLTSELDGSEWSALRLCRFKPRGNSPKHPLCMSLVGLQSRFRIYGEHVQKINSSFNIINYSLSVLDYVLHNFQNYPKCFIEFLP
jgi:hypothetical protein